MGKLFGRRWNGKRNTLRRSNAGFSLVEMVVSLAIMGIVAGAVGTFMVTGNSSYMRGNSEVTLQEEAQLTANQLIDLIIDVEEGISFSAATDTADLVLLNEENAYLVRWESTTQEINLYEATVDSLKDADGKLDATASAIESKAAGALLAEYVTSFNVDLTNLKTDRTVKLQMDFSFQSKTASIDESIRLRNELPDTPYDGKQQLNWITGIEISPKSASVEQGSTQLFTCTMTGDDGAIAEGVTWKVERTDGTAVATGTSISPAGALTAILNVSESETVGDNILIVTVTSVADTGQSAYALVNVTQFSGVTTLEISPTVANIMRGDSQTFTYTITGTDAALKSPATWTVEPADSSVTLNPGTGFTENNYNTNYEATDPDNHSATLHVSDAQTTGAKILKVTVTVLNKSATAYVTVTPNNLYKVELIARELTPHPYTDATGSDKIEYSGVIECLTGWADYANGYPNIDWSVINDPSNKYKIGLKDGSTTQYTTTLYCGNQYNTTVRVHAEVELWEGYFVPVEIDITIPDLKTVNGSTYPYIDSDNFVLDRNSSVSLTLKNYTPEEESDIKWTIEGIDQYNYTKTDDYGDCLGFDEVAGAFNGNADVSEVTGLITYDQLDLDADKADGWYVTNSIDQMEGGGTQSNTSYWKKTGSGYTATIHCSWFMVWDKEYRVKVIATDTSTGEEIASTIVLIPEVNFLFADSNGDGEGDRIYYITQPVYYKNIPLELYGFKNGQNGENGGTNRMFLEAKLECEEGTKASTTLIWYMGPYNDPTVSGANGVTECIAVQISEEPNTYLSLTLRDVRKPDFERTLVIVVNNPYSSTE